MKRVLLSITGTVLGLVALLSFKSHGTAAGGVNALPTANLPAGATTGSTPRPTSTTGPPTHTRGSSHPHKRAATVAPTARTVLGDAARTPYGVVQVKVTLLGSKITNVGFAQLTYHYALSQEIDSQAAPILVQQTISSQSAQIDGVSGASYTSQGYYQSLQSALDKAGVH